MLYDKLNEDLKKAMIEKNKDSLSTLRLLKSAIVLYKINNKVEEITDEIVVDVASKQVKTHRESIIEFQKGQREDLIKSLEKEIKLLQTYLPEQLTDEELEREISLIFEKIKPNSRQDMGKIMKEVSISLKGKADMKKVSEIVNYKINSL